jgi:DNA-binding SARP family transcriptional activator
VQFRILGPFEVLDGERVLDVGGGKQRSVLALLLLHANQVVSSDRLVDELWTDEPPPSASKIVQVHVSRLRKALEGAGEAVLLTRGHGYELRVAPGQLDVERFQSLLEEGRAAVAAGDPEKADEILRTALGLWRGPPLAEFAYEDFAQAEIARLEDLRLAALEERIEADLALGRHDAVVQELEQLACRHPLRERLRRQLMLALYRSGRQAEALDVYRQARQTFADDLGLEPSPLLQQLERAILTHDPALQPPARRAAREQARRRGSLVIAAGALLLVAAAISVTLIEVRGSGKTPGLASVVPDSLAIVDPKTNEITGEVPIPGGPSLVAAGRRFVWVASDASRTISSVSADKPAVRQVVAANATPSALGADGDAVWVLDGNRRVLLKLEPAYGVPTRRFTLPRSPPQPVTSRRLTSLSVVAGARALWITDGSTRLLRVDPDSSRFLKALDVHEPLDDVAVGAGAVWATSGQASSVFQIDPQAGAVKTRIPIVNRRGTTAPFPVAVTVGQGSVWGTQTPRR